MKKGRLGRYLHYLRMQFPSLAPRRLIVIREKIAKAIEEFNKYRVPEARAKLISIKEKAFKIKFTGSFCQTCGFYDYFDDYKIILEDAGLKTKIVEIEEIENGAIVKFEAIE